jgi:integrase/recombinase XerD
MKLLNPDNERIKRSYLGHLKEARGFSESTLDKAEEAIHRFEGYTKLKDFRLFHIEQAKGFKLHLCDQQNPRTKKPLSHGTVYSVLNALKAFFVWLASQPGFKSRISYTDADYFSPSGATVSIAKAQRETRAPTVEQIRYVLGAMPRVTDTEKRDRALIATAIVTGARDRALASLKLRHVDILQGHILQDARTVKTKFSKTFTTWFFPVGDDIEAIVLEWVRFLKDEKLWGLDDPLFPKSLRQLGGAGHFEWAGLDRLHWSDAGPIRTIFKRAFEGVGLPYFNPHTFRNTLAALGQELCDSWEEMQAWAQNLGHESLTTTFGSYGKVAASKQGELVRNAGKNRDQTDHKFEQIIEMLQEQQQRKEAGESGVK